MKFVFFFFGLISLAGMLSAQTPKVGDLVTNEDGTKGVVFWMQADGSRGWMVALHDLPGQYKWGAMQDLPAIENAGAGGYNKWTRMLQALKDTAGYQHTAALRAALGSGNQYAAQAVDFGQGWYLPSVGQLRTLYGAWGMIQKAVVDFGGSDLKKESYWSSSEYDEAEAWQVYCYPGEVEKFDKSSSFNVRPVRSFSMQTLVYDTTLTYQWNTGEMTPGITHAPQEDALYEVVVYTQAGCSNKASQQVFIGGGQSKTIYASVCEGETYAENGFQVAEEGIWYQTLKGPGGCEVEMCLVLEVHKPVETFLEATVCEGHIYSAHNFSVWEAGTYHQTWTGSNGCDSLVTLTLKVNPVYDTVFYDTLCAGDTYDRHGFLLPRVTESNTYVRNESTFTGCDSVITLHLEVRPVNETFFTASVCSGEPYTGHGFALPALWKDTLCVDSLVNAGGCDSLVRLLVNVHAASYPEWHDSVCWGEAYTGYGFEIPEVRRDTLCVEHYQTVWGCDSVVQLALTVLPEYFLPLEEEICDNESYFFQGKELKEAGIYRENLKTGKGCDSILELTLRVKPSYLYAEKTSTCGNIPYDFRGRTLGETGIYYDSLKTLAGCDSVFKLELTVLPFYQRTIDTVICRGMRYTGEGFDQSEPGTYTQSLHTAAGCDSILVLQLGVEEYFEGEMRIDLKDCALHEYLLTVDCHNPDKVPEYICRWDWGEGMVSDEEKLEYRYQDSGSYEVVVQTVTPAGCVTTMQQSLIVPYYQEDFSISADRTSVGEWIREVHFSTEKLPGMDYQWDFGDEVRASGAEVSHVYERIQQDYFEVSLTVANPEGCLSENRIRIKAYPGVKQVPNTFSPNGDGVNDWFMKGYSLRIANRAGIEIFKGEDGWDGSHNGQPAPEDTYFYELTYPTEIGEKSQTGYITLVR